MFQEITPYKMPQAIVKMLHIKNTEISDEECQELMSEGSPLGRNHIVAVSCYSEVIPVIQYLCGRLTETQM